MRCVVKSLVRGVVRVRYEVSCVFEENMFF